MRARHPGNYDLYARQTAGQTVGPFFAQGLVRVRSVFHSEQLCSDERDVIHNFLVQEFLVQEGGVADASSEGERQRIEGTIYDGLGRPIPDAMVEIWQADAQGRYRHPLQLGERYRDATFLGFGRAATDAAGRYFFETLRPGSVPGPGGSRQAAHINVVLGARGMARLAFTRIYFADDPALAIDPVLARVPPARRSTLLARAASPHLHVFDIHLQGEHETVFFDF